MYFVHLYFVCTSHHSGKKYKIQVYPDPYPWKKNYIYIHIDWYEKHPVRFTR